MISLRAYHLLEDAWTGGVADWCHAASNVVLGGGQAWMVTASDGQANWIKRRLLSGGVSLVGVRFLDARALRRELCRRRGLPPPAIGRHALELLLRLHAVAHEKDRPELAMIARHPAACLAALNDFAAAGWLDDAPELFEEMLPSALRDWFPVLRATGSWVPDVDRQVARPLASGGRSNADALAVCVFGWDATSWPVFDLLLAAARNAARMEIYAPLPRGTSEALQQDWLTALETSLGTALEPCASSGFVSAQSVLANRLEGSDLGDSIAEIKDPPEILVGQDTDDMAVLTCDLVAHWLAERTGDPGARLALLCPARNASSVAVARALVAAGIAVEDEVGEQPEPSLSIQIQRALVAYERDDADIQAFLVLLELLREHGTAPDPARPGLVGRISSLDPAEIQRALHGAFADAQHHSVRVLGEMPAFARNPVAGPVRELIAHLGEWPVKLPWCDFLRRWEECLHGLNLTIEALEPLWSQLERLPIHEDVPREAFFQFVTDILAGVAPRRAAGGANRFARVIMTSLDGAMGQTWAGALFLDSNEGSWPIYPGENCFLDDVARTRLNLRRAALAAERGAAPTRGYLLTAADRAQLEHFRFLEVLENCTGPLAFAAVSRDPAEPSKELYANEWALRCLVESGQAPGGGGQLLERWRRAVMCTERSVAPLAMRDAAHLREIFGQRRDPAVPFDEYLFDFSVLQEPDELPWGDAWSGRELESAYSSPAEFALQQIFGAAPQPDNGDLQRREKWAVGRLVHHWARAALGASPEPRRMTAEDWPHVLTGGLARARAESESLLRRSLRASPGEITAAGAVPLWWQSALSRAEWAARRCLEALAELAQLPGPTGRQGPRWLCVGRSFHANLKTARGPLRMRGRCDVLLLDRPGLAGAAAHLIDLRTGSAAATGSPTSAQLEAGEGLGLGTLLLAGLAQGLDPETSQAGVIHPYGTYAMHWNGENTRMLQPLLEQLAAQQASLVFGEKIAPSGGRHREDAGAMPLATTPIASSVLAAKAALALATADKFGHGDRS